MSSTKHPLWLALSTLIPAFPAHAAPGLDAIVYGATVEPGVTEIETRYGRLTGDIADGDDAFVLEVAHGFSSRFYGAGLAIFERAPGGSRKLEALALEGITPLGRIRPLGIDVALYAELEAPLHDAVKLETKLLLEKRSGAFDARLNLIAERPFQHGAPIEFGYAASADVEVAHDFRLGLEAFGDLGNTHRFSTRAEHYLGPSISAEIEKVGAGELELRAGYLFALGRARDVADGQLRFGIAYEFKH